MTSRIGPPASRHWTGSAPITQAGLSQAAANAQNQIARLSVAGLERRFAGARRFADPKLRASISCECRDIHQDADMIQRIPENVCSWLADWSVVPMRATSIPPRDPNDDDAEEEEDEDDSDADEVEPAVIREPDE
jgi:hypothetical protein